MKQNIKNNILKAVRLGFALFFLASWVLGFIMLPVSIARAGSNNCNYGVSFGTNGQTTVQQGQTIPFTLNVTQGGGILCSNSGGTVVVGDALSNYIFFQCPVPSYTSSYAVTPTASCNAQILVPSQFFSNGAVLHLKAGVLDGQTSSSNWSNIDFDTVSSEVDVTIASAGNTSAGNNSQCSNKGIGYIWNGSSCVEASDPSSFTCSASNQSCPTGLTCVVGDGQCEQPCSSTPSCVYQNETCNTQGYCTAGGQASNPNSPSSPTTPNNPSSPITQSPVTTAPSSGNGSGIACTGTGQGSCPSTNLACVNNVCVQTLYNPLPESDLTHVFLLITKSFLDIMGIWAVMFIIFGGFQMVLSSGNEEAYIKAKKTITWAVLGLAVAILSFSIVAIVEDLLQANIQAPTTTTTTTTSNNSAPTTPNNSAPTTPNNSGTTGN